MAQYILTNTDRCRLGRMLTTDQTRGIASWHALDDLDWQLEKAQTLPPEAIPDDVVTMNSTVRLVNVNSPAELICTVVYPEDVDVVDDGISVLEPFGTRLIGCKVGDLVEYDEDSGTWRVAEILFQPEKAGAFHL